MSDAPRPFGAGGDEAAPSFTAEDLAEITGGTLLARSSRPIRGAAVDTRLVRPGELFVALPGERTDGHRFLAQAVDGGAAALIVTEALPEAAPPDDVTVVRVADGLAALQALATAWRTRFRPIVVGITGSIAKTSTKEAVAGVLSGRYTTLRSEGNQNNEIGLPLSVLRLRPEHEAAVLEMGMYVGGEIRDLARIARPRIGVVTAVQPVHLSRIGSIEAVEQAKGELVEALPREADGGVAVLNSDDPRVRRMSARTDARILGYGFESGADVRADEVRSAGLSGMTFTLHLPDQAPVAATIPTHGRLAVHNALAAAAVGSAVGLDPDTITAGLARGWAAPHRSEIVRAGGVTIVDDSYNASPASVMAALELLSGLSGRRIAVLGEMLELGAGAEAGHLAVGRAAAGTVALLVVVGHGATAIADGATAAGLDPGAVVRVPDVDAATSELRARLRDGDVVLVKASRGAALERIVDALREDAR
ncbi:MAG TPA: UDP-N-acetylmuramoyl-tripeptide--D-alanyl-D-alanine ligase [Candidatus Limnocylindrales bacterium]